MLDTIKHASQQKGHFLCTLIKGMLLCKASSEDYYLNPEAQSALYLGKHIPITHFKNKSLIGLTKLPKN